MQRTKYPLILDGPTGTELIARGYRPDPLSWTGNAAIECPELLLQIHLEYLEAGAQILRANTFRTSSYAAQGNGLSDRESRDLGRLRTRASMVIAKKAIALAPHQDGKIPIAGAIGPLGDCYRPDQVPSSLVLDRVHTETASWLVEEGCDLLLLETMGTAGEACSALAAGRRISAKMPIFVSFLPDASGKRLLSGEDLLTSAVAAVQAGATAILCNCAHPEVLDVALEVLSPLRRDGIALGAYPNTARMEMQEDGVPRWNEEEETPSEQIANFVGFVRRWVENRVAVLGACCGATSAHIAALRALLASIEGSHTPLSISRGAV